MDAKTMDEMTHVTVAPARYVLLPLAHWVTGYTIKAMERKIERGDWTEGKVWIRAPDGRIHIDIVGSSGWKVADTCERIDSLRVDVRSYREWVRGRA